MTGRPMEPLTQEQKDILQMYKDGSKPRQIAEKMNRNPKFVYNVIHKLKNSPRLDMTSTKKSKPVNSAPKKSIPYNFKKKADIVDINKTFKKRQNS